MPFPPILAFLFFRDLDFLRCSLPRGSICSFFGFFLLFLLFLCKDDLWRWEDYIDQFDCSLIRQLVVLNRTFVGPHI